jgi:hypothetical protein
MSGLPLRYLLCLALSISFTAQVNAFEKNDFEITPLVGYRFGGEFDLNNATLSNSSVKLSEDVDYGLLLAWKFDPKRQGEFLVSHYNSNFSQSFDPAASNHNIAITYAHLGGNVPISEGDFPVYITGGLGLTHLSPEDALLDSETRFSMNVGIATKIPVSENISFRFGGRVYATFFNSDSTIFCNEETCAISISSDLWVQSEVNAGITFTF